MTEAMLVAELVGLSGMPALERDHHAAQEPVEMLLLAIGERLGEKRLLLHLDTHRLLVLVPPLLGQLDDHAAPVVGIAQAADETLLLQRVEPARHSAARQVGAAC